CTTQRRGRVVAHEIYKSLAGIGRSDSGIVQYLFELRFCEIARGVPAIALEVHTLVFREDNAFVFQEFAHPPFLTERPASRQLALAINDALGRYSLRRFVHNSADHARTTGVAERFADPTI